MNIIGRTVILQRDVTTTKGTVYLAGSVWVAEKIVPAKRGNVKFVALRDAEGRRLTPFLRDVAVATTAEEEILALRAQIASLQTERDERESSSGETEAAYIMLDARLADSRIRG